MQQAVMMLFEFVFKSSGSGWPERRGRVDALPPPVGSAHLQLTVAIRILLLFWEPWLRLSRSTVDPR